MSINWRDFFYAFFWCVVILGSLFPSVFLEGSVDFLFPDTDDKSMYSISQSFMYGMSMAVVIHLIDMIYIVFNNNVTHNKLKVGFLATLISLCIIIISVICISAYNSCITKVIGFIVFWITLFMFKLFCIETTKPDEVAAIKVYKEN